MFGIVLVFRPHEIAEQPATEKPISCDDRKPFGVCEIV